MRIGSYAPAFLILKLLKYANIKLRGRGVVKWISRSCDIVIAPTLRVRILVESFEFADGTSFHLACGVSLVLSIQTFRDLFIGSFVRVGVS